MSKFLQSFDGERVFSDARLDIPHRPAAVVKAISDFEQRAPQSKKAQNGASSWGDPQAFSNGHVAEEYPLDSLPPSVRAAVEEVGAFVQAPVPLVASAALSALSLAVQAHVDVKRAEKLTGPVGLFMATIADSGERKSTADSFFMKAIRDYEADQAEEAKPLVKDYQADLEAWEAKRAGIKDKIKSDTKARKPTIGLETDLRELEHAKPVAPKVPRMIYADVTPESLSHSLAHKWPSAGVVSAEAGIVFGSHGMGSDSVMRNLATLNQLWDGSTLTIDRRTSDSFSVKGARLTVALQVQEATIRSFMDKAGTLARGTGFLARFLIAWPRSTQGFRPYVEAPDHWPHMSAFNARVTEILKKPIPLDDSGCLIPLMLTLSPDAKGAWIAFHDTVEAQLRAGGELSDVRDVASKSADNVARLAALFHVFSGATGPIGADAIDDAGSIVAWHLSESKRFFAEVSVPNDLADAAKLDAWLIEYCRSEKVETVDKSRVLQFGPIRKADPMSFALRSLEEMERVRIDKIGRRSVVVVNPKLLDNGGEK
ncbi:hypothetical protein AWB71_00683 [Caballeronia peredens]|nr:hypothetical protein AWB71_00683 [Caballeronia peredens]